MDVKKQINVALETGDVAMGSNKTVDSLLYSEPKLVFLASNCPKSERETISYYCSLAGVGLVKLKENSMELGSGLGRPHPVSAVSVLDEGESTILEAGQ